MNILHVVYKMSTKKTLFLAFCLSMLVIIMKLWDLKYVHGSFDGAHKRTVIKIESKIDANQFQQKVEESKKSETQEIVKKKKKFTGLRRKIIHLKSNVTTNSSFSNISSTIADSSSASTITSTSTSSITSTTATSSIATTFLSTIANLTEELPPALENAPTNVITLPRACIGMPRTDDKLKWSAKPEKCQNDTYVVWLIKSSIYRNYLRKFIRDTWAKDDVPLSKDGQTFYTRRIFLLGSEPDDHVIPYLQKEIHTYGDILQGTFVDTPQSVTQKVFLGMMFIKDNCPQVKITIVADDEAVFAPWNMLILLSSVLGKEKFYGGFSFGPSKPDRDKNSKWHLSEKDYHCAHYPSYSIRTVYFISKQTMEEMYYLGVSYQKFPFDDILFGGLAEELGVEKKFFQNLHYSECQRILEPNPSVVLKEQVVCHGSVKPSDQELVWQKFCQSPVIRSEVVDINLAYCDDTTTKTRQKSLQLAFS